ncbi:MAG: two-partner secretion domain-containing protein, partial [Planctomycetota bacterium]
MNLLRTSSQKSFFKSVIVYFLTCCMFFNTSLPIVLAGPEGAQVVNGDVSIQQSGYNTTITASDRAIINYSSFDITRPEIVQFIQPGTSASVLNRILSANPTNINGTLLANGRVFFVNPAGVYFGNGAQVNVNQLVASALNITDADFISGRYNFVGGEGSVINAGDITAEKVYLIGRQVANSGSISCPAGYVVMASGDRVFLGEPGSDIVLEIEGPSLPESGDPIEGSGVLNEGTVEAAGGTIVLAAAGDIYSQAISNVGSLSTSVETGDAGQIKLTAADGKVINSGSIKATSSSGKGGNVQVLGDRVGLLDSAEIDVSGSNGGGTVLIGGNYQGQGEIPTARRTYISENSSIKADATENGDGGKVIVWADEITGFYGNISARGGADGGDGGFAEVSGHDGLIYEGSTVLSAAQGRTGTLLLDPGTVTIDDVGLHDSQLDDQQILSGDGLSFFDWTISDEKVESELNNADVLIQALTSITVNYAIDASGNANTNNLTLGAPTINLKDPITLKPGASLLGEVGNATTNVSENGLISNAISLTESGGTVSVADGTYTEDLTVDKSNLTLKSVNGRDNTTIQLVDGVGIDIGSGGSGFTLGGAASDGFEIKSGGSTTFDIQLTNAPSDVEISWNTIDTTGNASMGINIGAAGATDLTINQNNFIAEEGDGSIWGEVFGFDTTVSNNTFTGPGGLVGGYAIQFKAATGASTITGNNISGYGWGVGVLTGGGGTSGLTISDNTISNCVTGIGLAQYQAGDITTVDITGNALSNNTTGVKIYDGGGVKASNFTIQGNSFIGNTTGLANNHNSESVTAEQNYWGDVDGPGSGDPITEAVADSVDYSPWWGGDYIGDAHAVSWIWGTDDSIQDAIDLASTTVSDKIYITSGIYIEAVNVNKQLDGLYFRGDGSVASEIDGTLTLSNAVASNTGVDIYTQNDGDLTLNTVSDTGTHSLLVDTVVGTLNLDEDVTANGGITLDG